MALPSSRNGFGKCQVTPDAENSIQEPRDVLFASPAKRRRSKPGVLTTISRITEVKVLGLRSGRLFIDPGIPSGQFFQVEAGAVFKHEVNGATEFAAQ